MNIGMNFIFVDFIDVIKPANKSQTSHKAPRLYVKFVIDSSVFTHQ